jgi:hypothetical protein
MLQLMKDVPPHVVGVRGLGKIDKAEYDAVLLPEFERVASEFGEINFVFVLETNVGNITLGAWMDDIKAGLKHFSKWHKIAIVTDQAAIKKITDFIGAFIPGETKGYPISDIELAKAWVAAPKPATSH